MQAVEDLRALLAIRSVEKQMLRLQWLAAATRFEIAMCRHDRALKRACKAGFNPDQPRVPAGNPDGGQWSGGGGHGPRTRVAGDIPGGDPDVPKERPPASALRSAALKAAAKLLGPMATVAEIAQLGIWYRTYAPQIQSYNDPPRSLEVLQQAVSQPGPGYDIHHIVEQAQAEQDGFTREVIDSPDNLVRIPTLRHQEINGWYQRSNPDFGGLSPREYLSGRNWDVRRSVGIQALRLHGVLQ